MRIPLLVLALALPALAQEHVHDAGSDKDAKVPAHQAHPMDPSAPKPKGASLSLKAGGGEANAYVAKPKAKPRGAVRLLHEYWGLNDWVKSMADRLRSERAFPSSPAAARPMRTWRSPRPSRGARCSCCTSTGGSTTG